MPMMAVVAVAAQLRTSAMRYYSSHVLAGDADAWRLHSEPTTGKPWAVGRV